MNALDAVLGKIWLGWTGLACVFVYRFTINTHHHNWLRTGADLILAVAYTEAGHHTWEMSKRLDRQRTEKASPKPPTRRRRRYRK